VLVEDPFQKGRRKYRGVFAVYLDGAEVKHGYTIVAYSTAQEATKQAHSAALRAAAEFR